MDQQALVIAPRGEGADGPEKRASESAATADSA